MQLRTMTPSSVPPASRRAVLSGLAVGAATAPAIAAPASAADTTYTPHGAIQG
jgi:hypothetical protein